MKVKICNPEGTSIESRIRRLRRYLSDRRDDFEDEDEFVRWADKTMRSAIKSMADRCYIELGGQS